ncbi:WhiB family transcriptional regulator [Streptomyces sp. NPDC004237]|uniref:WhiB family transcriptional regulator n=1 Tax=Streptomyces sp. NPDC004237 TaxID=3154455 RepID=UPI0033B43513
MDNYTGSVPDTAGRRLDWMGRMACRDQDPDLFSEPAREHEARTVCALYCHVRVECLGRIKKIEGGTAKDRRDGVVAALTGHERWRMDASAPGHSDHPALVFGDEPPACGTYTALLRHLHLGEPLDSECWSAETRRARGRNLAKLQRAKKTPAVVNEETPPAPAAVSGKGSNPHERRVYRLWSEGFDDLQIARRMAISTPQVRRVRERLGLLPIVRAKAS